jgi:hypothetical protein
VPMGTKTASGWVLRKLARGNIVVTSSVVARTANLLELSPLFRIGQKIAEDWLVWMRLASRKKALILKQCHVYYHNWSPDKFASGALLEALGQVEAGLLEDDHVRQVTPWVQAYIAAHMYALSARDRQRPALRRTGIKLALSNLAKLDGLTACDVLLICFRARMRGERQS